MANIGSRKLNELGKRIQRVPFTGPKAFIQPGLTHNLSYYHRDAETGTTYIQEMYNDTDGFRFPSTPFFDSTSLTNIQPSNIAYRLATSGDAYLAIAWGVTATLQIFRKVNNTGPWILLTTLPESAQASDLAFNPSGTKLAIAAAGTGTTPLYLKIWNISGSTLTKVTGYTDSAGNGTVVAWNHDGSSVAMGSNSSPFIHTWNVSGDTLTKLNNPDVLPPASVDSVSWNHNNTSLAVGFNGTPFVNVYNRSGDTFTKIVSNSSQFSSTLPPGRGRAIAFNPDGSVLAVGHASSPFISFYNRSGDVFTKVANPATLPALNPYHIEWSPDGTKIALHQPNSTTVGALVIYNRSGDTYTRSTSIDRIERGLTAQGGVAWQDNQTVWATLSGNPFIQRYTMAGTSIITTEPSYAIAQNTASYAQRKTARFNHNGTSVAVGTLDVAPRLEIYNRNTTTGVLTLIASTPSMASNVLDVAWNNDGSSLAVGLGSSPFLRIFNRSGDTFTEVTGFTAPTNSVAKLEWNPAGTSLAYTTSTSPFIYVYNRSGNTFTQVANLPAAAANGIDLRWHPNGTALAILSNSPSYLQVYDRSGDTFTLLSAPATTQGWGRSKIAWSPNGQWIVVPGLTTTWVGQYAPGSLTYHSTSSAWGSPVHTYACEFSPDGTKIAMMTARNPWIRIATFNNGTITNQTYTFTDNTRPTAGDDSTSYADILWE